MLAMVEDKFTPLRMPDYGIVKITKSVTLPHAYIFRAEPGLQKALNNLTTHGIKFEKISAPLTVEVEQFLIDDMTKDAKKLEGHHEIKLTGHTEKATVTFPAGSILVRTAQPRAPLVFTLLEARSDDSLAAWNYMDDYLAKGKVYPVYKIMTRTPYLR
jgi:dipeptidyl-peptidase 4